MGPLEGIRALDLCRYPPGRYCSMILGDLGAEVIMVEATTTSGQAANLLTDDAGVLWIGQNRNKKCIAVNLKKEDGKRLFYRLAEKSDVIVEGNLPGVPGRLGIDYETLRKINPRLVYCSITGYGQDGPYARRSGHEINFASLAGIAHLTRYREAPPMYLQSFSIAGVLGGTAQAVIAITAALYARDRTGEGQYIDVSITDGAAFFHWVDGQQYLMDGRLPQPANLPTGSDMVWMNMYQGRDGKFFSVGCAEAWRWAVLCRLMGREDFIPHQFDAFEKQKEMYEAFSQVFATKDRDEWIRLLDEADVTVAPVYDFEGLFSDPHFKHRRVATEVEHPKLGTMRLLNSPFKFSETKAEVRSRPPLWAEHTDEVLGDLLGYGEEEIARLRRDEVVE